MSWGAVAGAAVGVIGNQLGKDKNGGAGTTKATKEPWGITAPILSNMAQQGSDLNARYQATPFNQQQQQAFANQYAQSDYMRGLVPSLLGQIQGQQLGFDSSNPTAKPTAFNWDATGGLLGGSGGGLAGGGNMSAANAADAAARQQPTASPSGWSWDGKFQSQDDVLSGLNFTGHDAGGNLVGTGGFGSWQYGAAAKPGTDTYRDMQEYFLRGGGDPNNVRGVPGGNSWENRGFQNAGGA